jgi:hypothetical protein
LVWGEGREDGGRERLGRREDRRKDDGMGGGGKTGEGWDKDDDDDDDGMKGMVKGEGREVTSRRNRGVGLGKSFISRPMRKCPR